VAGVQQRDLRRKTRRVVATFREERLFFASAFADLSVTFNGGNVADSYNSAAPGREPGPGRLGLVGSNGNIKFLGNSSTVDGVQLWNYVPGNNTGDRCTGQGSIGLAPTLDACSLDATTLPVGQAPYQQRLAERRELTPSTDDLRSRLLRCGNGPYPNLTVTSNATMPQPMTAVTGQNNRSAPAQGATPGYYCVGDLTFDTGANNGSIALHSSASRTNPVVIYATGDVKVNRTGTRLNCCQRRDDASRIGPDAAALQIYMVETRDTFVEAQRRSLATSPSNLIGMALYGPAASCGGGSQNEIFGSIICRSIDNVGGWKFHYDEALEGLGNTSSSRRSTRSSSPVAR
jgi:hypothetical protein